MPRECAQLQRQHSTSTLPLSSPIIRLFSVGTRAARPSARPAQPASSRHFSKIQPGFLEGSALNTRRWWFVKAEEPARRSRIPSPRRALRRAGAPTAGSRPRPEPRIQCNILSFCNSIPERAICHNVHMPSLAAWLSRGGSMVGGIAAGTGPSPGRSTGAVTVQVHGASRGRRARIGKAGDHHQTAPRVEGYAGSPAGATGRQLAGLELAWSTPRAPGDRPIWSSVRVYIVWCYNCPQCEK
jgi:hypothetical protein